MQQAHRVSRIQQTANELPSEQILKKAVKLEYKQADELEIHGFRVSWHDKSEGQEFLTHPDSYRSCRLSRCTAKGIRDR